ncbi:unnamed protein product, partial [Rotaria sp. Silwood1]
MSKLRIAIIGAGPCGLAQLLAFKQSEREQRVELVCFERQSDWGGLWLYTSQIGIDVHGEPIHSSMYRQLWANNPKESIEFADYTFYDHFGCFLPSYLPRAFIYDYLTATGHYHVPNMTNIDGVDRFPDRVLHSHEFRGADEFVGLNLLLIGSSFSGIDIVLQCYKFGARSVTISSRREPIGLKWPAEIKDAPRVVRIEGRTAHFKDGSSLENINAIIFCTGYR